MITFDTLRADHLGPYGSSHGLTPNFDALASDSVMFSNAYAVSSTTGPSHATIFTGLYPNEHGVLKNGVLMSDEIVTIGEVLRDKGYETAAFVSSYAVNSQFGLVQGFNSYDEDYNFKNRRLGELTIEAASEWIADQPNDQPWCVWVHLMDPHKPYRQPKEYLDPYINEDLEGNELDKASYKGAVAYMDSVLPELMQTIETQESPAGTLMAITADHGELFGEHNHYGHGRDLYEDAVRAPLIFRHPSLDARVIDSYVGLVDFSPTVLELLELDGMHEVSGKSLAKLVLGEENSVSRPLFMQRRIFNDESVKALLDKTGVNVAGPQWAIIDGGYKLTVAPEANEESLFNLHEDPQELNDLTAVDKENLLRMRSLLSSMLDSQQLRISK
ncbi:MAG: sulfatase, partial [Planctomycetota bacterium]|nr:sulfatase [Planctomycetota bacterium]